LPSTFHKVEPVSKKERVVSSLKKAILSGGLKSGEAIVEAKIAQQFGVGQGLIREALIELEHRGFVQRTPFSGTQVVQLSSEDAQQIFDIRIALEPLAVSLAGARLTTQRLDELNRLATKASRAADAQDLDTFFENHLAFRRQIWTLSGNKYLLQTLERAVVPLYALYLIRRPQRTGTVLETIADCVEHQRNILAAYRAGDAGDARRISLEFLQRAKEYLRTALPVETP
jgi:DNA-binding GntR family transcriptional regulator